MGQIVINYPDGKAVEIYTLLSGRYAIDIDGLSPAQAKAAVDEFIRTRLRSDYQSQKKLEAVRLAANDFDSNPPDPEFS